MGLQEDLDALSDGLTVDWYPSNGGDEVSIELAAGREYELKDYFDDQVVMENLGVEVSKVRGLPPCKRVKQSGT